MPSTPPRGDDQDQIPEQIIVGNQEQPLGNPSPGIPESSQTLQPIANKKRKNLQKIIDLSNEDMEDDSHRQQIAAAYMPSPYYKQNQTPHPRCELTIFISQNHSFLKTFCGEIKFKNG